MDEANPEGHAGLSCGRCFVRGAGFERRKVSLMPYRIEKKDGYVEVLLDGNFTAMEILKAVKMLSKEDPRKEMPDLWVIPEGHLVSANWHTIIVKGIQKLCPPDIVGRRSAVVASNEFYKAIVGMYCCEAESLPYNIRVFTSREAAEQWLMDGT